METACIYCGRTIENTSIWKNKTFCSEKCKKKHKMSDLKKRGRRRREEIQMLPSAFEQIYW